MTTYYCDKCGEFLGHDKRRLKPFTRSLKVIGHYRDPIGDDGEEYSEREETLMLCEACTDRFRDWLKGSEKQ